MADLKDQLLKAGLISEEQARQTAHKTRQDNKKLGPEGRKRQTQKVREEAQGQAEAQSQADRQRGREQGARRETKEQRQRETQHRKSTADKALQEGRVPNWEGNRTYYFADGQEVRFLQVNDAAAKLLETGKAAIVRENSRARYTLIVSGMAKDLREADPGRVVTFHEG